MSLIQFYIYRLDEISGSASKEYSLEKAMSKMKEDWKNISFDLIQYRETVNINKLINNFEFLNQIFK